LYTVERLCWRYDAANRYVEERTVFCQSWFLVAIAVALAQYLLILEPPTLAQPEAPTPDQVVAKFLGVVGANKIAEVTTFG